MSCLLCDSNDRVIDDYCWRCKTCPSIFDNESLAEDFDDYRKRYNLFHKTNVFCFLVLYTLSMAGFIGGEVYIGVISLFPSVFFFLGIVYFKRSFKKLRNMYRIHKEFLESVKKCKSEEELLALHEEKMKKLIEEDQS